MAAVLACGGADRAVLAGCTAAALHAQLPETGSELELIVCGYGGRRRPGLRVHRVRELPADARRVVDGLPVATPARTVLDLAAILDAAALERGVARTFRLDIATADDVVALMTRYPRRAGSRRLRTLLAHDGAPAFTRSDLEQLLLDLIRKASLPIPRTNAVVEGRGVDFLWPKERLTVERCATGRDQPR